jgi:hypothetical protein
MSTFTGILNISGTESSLNVSLLLRAGVPDFEQAKAAATQFLTQTRNLRSGQMILVDGQASSRGSIHIIRMTDAHAVPPESTNAIPLGIRASAKTVAARRSTKRSTKKASKKGASKKATKSAKRRVPGGDQ